MKQKIYLLGLLTAIVVVLGCLFKISHWPGAGVLLMLGIFLLVFLFLPLALRNHYLGAGNRKNMLLHIITWVTCLVVFVAMLFKVMHWPGAGVALIIALPFPYMVFLPAYIFTAARNRDSNIHNTVYVLLLLAGFSVFSLLLALNVSKERIDDSMQLSDSYNRVEVMLDDIPSAAGQSSVTNKIDEILSIIDDYQRRIFSIEGMSEEDWNNDPWNFPFPEKTSVADKALFIEGENPSYDTRLQTGLGELVSVLQKYASDEEIAGKIPLIFDFYETPDNDLGWTEDMFVRSPRVWSLIYLDALETNLKLIRAGI
jgi:hypothetical protein